MSASDSKSWDCAKHVRVRPDHHFQDQWLALRDVTSFSRIMQSVSVDQSGGLSMEIGVLHLSHAMLVLAELTVCSSTFARKLAAFWVHSAE